MNKITIELCAEDRARLDKLAEVIEAMTTPQAPQICYESAEPEKEAQHPAEMEPTPLPEETAAWEQVQTKARQHLAANMNTIPSLQLSAVDLSATEPEPAAETAPAVTHKDIAKLVIDLAGAGKKEDVKNVVTAYAAKVSDIPEDKLAEVYQQLSALKEVTA